MNGLKKSLTKRSSTKQLEPPVDAEDVAPAADEVEDPVMEARDADEGALDTPHKESKEEENTTEEAAKEDPPQEEEEKRDAEPEETDREEAPAPIEEEKQDNESVKTEPSNDEEEDVETAPAPQSEPETIEEETPVEPALSTVKEEEEEPAKEEFVAQDAPSREDVNNEAAKKQEKTMNVDTVAASDEEEATLRSKGTMDSNKEMCMTPIMRTADFCGFNLRACFE